MTTDRRLTQVSSGRGVPVQCREDLLSVFTQFGRQTDAVDLGVTVAVPMRLLGERVKC